MAHVRTMAVAQPFLSGAISKTINMPEDSTVADVANVYLAGAQSMLKALALYRDGSKLSQPLAATLLNDEFDLEDDLDEDSDTSPFNASDAIGEAERIISALPSQDARALARRILGQLRGDREQLPSRRAFVHPRRL